MKTKWGQEQEKAWRKGGQRAREETVPVEILRNQRKRQNTILFPSP